MLMWIRRAFRVAKDPRFDRLPCSRKLFTRSILIQTVSLIARCEICIVDTGTYADDCLVQRVTVAKCYIVATVSLALPSLLPKLSCRSEADSMCDLDRVRG